MVAPDIMGSAPTAGTTEVLHNDRHVATTDDTYYNDNAERHRSMSSRIAWAPIIAGALLAIAIIALSSSFAYATGVMSVAGVRTYGWGAGIWSVITAGIAFFIGGMFAAGLLPTRDGRYGMAHGLMVWGLAVPLILLAFSGSSGFSSHGLIVAGMAHMTTNPARGQPNMDAARGAAWGQFISLAVGLCAAAVGGTFASNSDMPRNRVTNPSMR